jgi:hypothetical protein
LQGTPEPPICVAHDGGSDVAAAVHNQVLYIGALSLAPEVVRGLCWDLAGRNREAKEHMTPVSAVSWSWKLCMAA